MAKRMFSDEITTSDAFLDMPTESQLLYFHIGMNADDDGFIGNAKMIQRYIGAGDDSMKILIAKKFIIAFENGVMVVKHWRINNFIRGDIYKETTYLEQKNKLFIKKNGAYSTNNEDAVPLPKGHITIEKIREMNRLPELEESTVTEPLRNRNVDKSREEKDSIDKISKDTYGEFKNVKLTKEEYQKLVEKITEKNTNILIEELSGYLASTPKRYASHYATLLNWARRKYQEVQRSNKPKRTIA